MTSVFPLQEWWISKHYSKSLVQLPALSRYLLTEQRQRWRGVVCTVTRGFLFASIIVSIRCSQDYFDKLFQKLLLGERIINRNFYSWKDITVGKTQLNSLRNRRKIPTNFNLFAKSLLIKRYWAKCLQEWYSRFRDSNLYFISVVSGLLRRASSPQFGCRVSHWSVESLGILRYADVPNSALKQRLWPSVSNAHLAERERGPRSRSQLLLGKLRISSYLDGMSWPITFTNGFYL